MIEKLTTSDELSGLLNVAMGGLKRLKAERGFEHADIEEIAEMYKEGASKIRDFINEQCILETSSPDLEVATYDLHSAYATFCKKRGTSFLDLPRFGAELKALGVERKYKRRHGSREYVYAGIGLRVASGASKPSTSIPTKESQTLLMEKRSDSPASNAATPPQ